MFLWSLTIIKRCNLPHILVYRYCDELAYSYTHSHSVALNKVWIHNVNSILKPRISEMYGPTVGSFLDRWKARAFCLCCPLPRSNTIKSSIQQVYSHGIRPIHQQDWQGYNCEPRIFTYDRRILHWLQSSQSTWSGSLESDPTWSP